MNTTAEALERRQPSLNLPRTQEITQLALEASGRIAEFVKISPVVEDQSSGVLVKNESVQPGRSFKDRGAGNAVMFHEENGENSVITASAGNHGLGIARAAKELGLEATIIVNTNAADEKKARIKNQSAKLVEFGANFDESLAYALDLADAEGSKFVHPFANDLVMAGQATIALELLHQEPEMTHLVVPAGGGGLLAGVGSVIKELRSDVAVVVAQVEENTAFVDSLLAGAALHNRHVDVRFEGIAVGNINPLTFEIARKVVDRVVVVEREEVNHAIYDFKEEHKVLLEPAGAVGLAAARKLKKLDDNSRIVTIATGANPRKITRAYIQARAQRFGWSVDN